MPKKIEMSSEEQQLFNELKKLSKRANQRIVRLEREFGKDTWATRYLKDKLEADPLRAWTITGRVKVNKNMTLAQMKATIKATNEFLNSQISTKRGIAKTKKKVAEKIKTQYGIDEELDEEEYEALENFFYDNEVNSITNYLGGSDVLSLIEYARDQQLTKVDFREQIKAYQRYNIGSDFDIIINRIYDKYVRKLTTRVKNQLENSEEIKDMILNAETIEELEEIRNILTVKLYDNDINKDELRSLLSLLEEKEEELEQ